MVKYESIEQIEAIRFGELRKGHRVGFEIEFVGGEKHTLTIGTEQDPWAEETETWKRSPNAARLKQLFRACDVYKHGVDTSWLCEQAAKAMVKVAWVETAERGKEIRWFDRWV